jgi:hypothetical protein
MPNFRGFRARRARLLPALALLLGATELGCSSSTDTTKDGTCFPDADGVTGGAYTINLTVDDDGFSKNVLSTQDNSTVTLTLTNAGSVPHGFAIGCVSVTSEFPHLPAGCPSTSCFPDESSIGPLDPGESATATFFTPTPDNLIYPFQSNAPDDATVPELNGGQWTIM